MTIERIFIIGGTGNIGKAVIQELISKKVAFTLFARNPEKVAKLFPTGDFNLIEGDLKDLAPIKDAIKGHTRLFIAHSDFSTMVQDKATIAQFAYDAGVKQIVNISSIMVNVPWRTNFTGEIHRQAEEAILAIPNRGKFVALRPGRFMSNLFWFDPILPDNTFHGIDDEGKYHGWISTDDIGVAAARILMDSVEKHDDAVYEMVADCITHAERAEIMSRVLGRNIQYKKLSAVERYDEVSKFNFPHIIAYALSNSDSSTPTEDTITTGLPILLGRNPETFEEFITKNKHLL